MLRATYLLLLFVCIAPTIPGLAGVIFSSLGYLPPIGLDSFNIDGYLSATRWAGAGHSIILTVFTSVTSTYLAAFFCFSILQRLWLNKHWHRVESFLSPLLAMPHVAFAIGFAFLFSPTGMIARLVTSSIGIELDTSSTTWLVQDPNGLGLTLALAFKEVPFLLLMSIPILQQLKLIQTQQLSASLGYSPNQMWWKVVLPQWLPRIRFALFAVMAYGVSVVDLSLILGPNTPPTYSVLVWQWFNDPDLTTLPRAAAGAMILLLIATFLMCFIIAIEKLFTAILKNWQFSGRYSPNLPGVAVFSSALALAAGILPLTLLWSFAQRWRFPDLLPSRLSSQFWQYEWHNILPTISNSLLLALVSSLIALVFAIVAHEYKLKYRFHLPQYIIAIPMLIPQLSILFGLQISSLFIGGDNFYIWVLWAHVFFAFPFVYLSLDGPWSSYDNNYSRTALSLGKSPLFTFIYVKTALLFPAIMYAWAIGASVSLAQYLPTLMLGGGRLATITTEAVALSSGFDRRVTAIYALWQALLPFVFFTLAVIVSRYYTNKSTIRSKEAQTNDSLSQKPHHPKTL